MGEPRPRKGGRIGKHRVRRGLWIGFGLVGAEFGARVRGGLVHARDIGRVDHGGTETGDGQRRRSEAERQRRRQNREEKGKPAKGADETGHDAASLAEQG